MASVTKDLLPAEVSGVLDAPNERCPIWGSLEPLINAHVRIYTTKEAGVRRL
jgi:hypothetical protein